MCIHLCTSARDLKSVSEYILHVYVRLCTGIAADIALPLVLMLHDSSGSDC